MNQIKRAGLARENVGAVQLAEHQRAKPERVANADDLAIAHDHQGKRSLDLPQGRKDAARGIRLRQQMQDDLAIDRGLEDRALLLEFIPKQGRIDQIPIMPDGQLPPAALAHQRLGILDVARSRGRVSHVPDGPRPFERFKIRRRKDLRTRPIATCRRNRQFGPSEVTMPALSCPRCWRAKARSRSAARRSGGRRRRTRRTRHEEYGDCSNKESRA